MFIFTRFPYDLEWYKILNIKDFGRIYRCCFLTTTGKEIWKESIHRHPVFHNSKVLESLEYKALPGSSPVSCYFNTG